MLCQYPGDNNKIVPSSQKTSVSKSSDEKSMPSSKKITLRSSDGETFEVEEAVALESKTIKHMIEESSSSNQEVITLPIVSGNILAKVLQYCEKHIEDDRSTAKELSTWDADFVKLDKDTLFQLVLAANYLGIERLVDLASEGAWSKVRPEIGGLGFRKMYGNNCSSYEDEEIEMGYLWVSGSYTG
jgi:S-phase kinase-associated protein 1